MGMKHDKYIVIGLIKRINIICIINDNITLVLRGIIKQLASGELKPCSEHINFSQMVKAITFSPNLSFSDI